MKRTLFLSLSVLMILCSASVFGQKPENAKAINKLKLLYEEGKFLKLEFKCYNMSMHEEVKREPLLYLYWSMTNYQIAQNDEYELEYPDAYKDAVKYAIKFRKKDKKKQFTKEGGEHLKMMHAEVTKTANDFYAEDNYKKAKKNYKLVAKIDPTDVYPWLMRSVCELELKFTSEARASFEAAMKMDGAEVALEALGEKERDRLKEEFLSYFEEKDAAADGSASGKKTP